MNGKTNTAAEIRHSQSASMVSDLSPEAQSYTRMARTPRKAAMFGKRSNSMRRNPRAEVTKQGWLYKQASSGVKQWNKRWFVLTDRCLFYYKDEKEDSVLGSLPLLSFRIGGVQSSDSITRKFAFKVWLEEEEEEQSEDGELKPPVVFCMQAEHAGTRTYYFSTDSHEEQQDWIRAMSDAAEVHHQPQHRTNVDATADVTMVTKAPDSRTQQHPHPRNHNDTDSDLSPHPKTNGVDSLETPPLSTVCSDQEVKTNDGPDREAGSGDGVGGAGPDHVSHPNGWSSSGPPNTSTHNSSKPPPARNHGGQRAAQGHQETGVASSQNHREQQENVVLRRGFVPRTAPEKVAQRKSSMAQLQQWVNQRRGMASQEDINSPSRYYPVNRGVLDYYGYPGGPQYVDEFPLYPPGVRPDSICSVSAVGGYDRRWTVEEKRRSLRDGFHSLYGPQVPHDPWGSQYYGGMETSMRRLSIQPRSRSVPRSPSSSSGGPYSPVPPNFASPARSPSTRFDRFPGRMREDVIYADPSVYGLRRSLSSPKYDFPGDRRSLSQGLYHHNYPVSPSIRSRMEDILDLQLQRNLDYLDQQVPPFHDVYSRELHPTLKLNEIETSKLLGRLCEQNQILKDHETVVHRLRMEKDSLEEALVATHQEMELYHNQPMIIEKLQFKKETQQNQLINIRGELSQASSALTTTRMEFEALEDEANAIHGDLWEQLNAGGQSELVRRHIQKEFWRVQDVLEGLHKSNSSRGTDTAKHRVASGASGSFSTNSPASPLSSVSLTSPLSPFSPVPGCQASPNKQLGVEVSTGHTPPRATPDPKPATGPCSDSRTHPEVHRRSGSKSPPKSCLVPSLRTDPKPRCGPRSSREPEAALHAHYLHYHACESYEHTFPHSAPAFHNLSQSLGRLDPVAEEMDQNSTSRTSFDQPLYPDKARAREQIQHSHVCWRTSNCSREVRIGIREDVFPDSYPSHFPVKYHDGHRKVSSKRRLSMPESQDSYRPEFPSLHHSPDVYTQSPHCSRSSRPEAHHLHQQQHLAPHHLRQPRTSVKRFTYPNSQGELDLDPVICIITQADPQRDHSGKVFMQTHL